MKSMATPYIVQKVSLNSSNSGYHHPDSQGEFKCSGTTHNNPNYYRCHFACANWCPICEVHRGPRCGRRRSRSEGLEADPLRERNRLCDSRHDIEHWRKKVVKEYDLCSYQQNSNEVVQQADNHQSQLPREPLCEASLPQPMDIDGTVEHHRTVVPVKKYKDHFMISRSRYQCRNFDNSFKVTQNLFLPEVSENPKHLVNSYDAHGDVCPDKGHSISGSLARKSTKVSFDVAKRYCVLCNQAWPERANDGEHFCQKPKAHNVDNHLHLLHDHTIRQDTHFSGTLGENHHCDHSCPQNEEVGNISSRQPFVANTASTQDHYLCEVEVLRSKLRELRDGVDGKRLRQRSESEPGTGFGGGSQDSSWEPKRARDDSPGLTENLDCCSIEDTKNWSYVQHQSHVSVSHSSHLQAVHLLRPSAHRGQNTKVNS